MALQLTLKKTPDKVSEFEASSTTYTFDAEGGTIGRSPSNTWTLHDPDRFLSSCHCEILFADNQYYIVDLSTNGTFVNGSPEPLGKGVKAPLADGDTFEIGDFAFSVKSVTGSSDSSSSPFGGASSGGAAIDDLIDGSGGSPFADPFGSSSPPSEDVSLSPEGETQDPLEALDHANHANNAETDGLGPFGEDSQGLVDDPYGGMGEVDQSPGLDQAIAWPKSSQQDLIPDDWDDDLLDSKPARPPESPPAATNGNSTSGNSNSTQSEEPVVDPFAQPAPSRQAPPTRGDNVDDVNVEAKSPKPARRVQSQQTQAKVTPTAAPRSERQPSAPSSAVAGEADRRFLAAMGLDAASLSDEQVNVISEMAGALMREVVEGMMQVLRSRTNIKNEFRMNVTTIEPVENNPLKFSVGVDEALENMFLKDSKAYKEPVQAIRESFQEIGEHQLAMIAGIRVGFEKMMARFDPSDLEKLFKRQGKTSALPGLQQAKHWNSYCEYYGGFSDNMESSFQTLFGSDFVQAYEDQLRKLSASRKK